MGAKATGRYSLHDLVRLFASGHLITDERAAVQRQHAEHYLSVMWETDRLYKQGNEFIAQGLALFDREWANIQAGQQWAAANVQADEAAQRRLSSMSSIATSRERLAIGAGRAMRCLIWRWRWINWANENRPSPMLRLR